MSKTKKIVLIVALVLIAVVVLGALAMAFNAEKLFWRAVDKVSNFVDDLIPDKKPAKDTEETDSDTEYVGEGLIDGGAETTPGYSKLYPAI